MWHKTQVSMVECIVKWYMEHCWFETDLLSGIDIMMSVLYALNNALNPLIFTASPFIGTSKITPYSSWSVQRSVTSFVMCIERSTNNLKSYQLAKFYSKVVFLVIVTIPLGVMQHYGPLHSTTCPPPPLTFLPINLPPILGSGSQDPVNEMVNVTVALVFEIFMMLLLHFCPSRLITSWQKIMPELWWNF